MWLRTRSHHTESVSHPTTEDATLKDAWLKYFKSSKFLDIVIRNINSIDKHLDLLVTQTNN